VKRQTRWFDNFVIGTKNIGPIVAALPVTINRTRAGEAIPWEAEVASDPDGKDIVWQSHAIDGAATSVTVDDKNGQFVGTDEYRSELSTVTHWVRVRRTGEQNWSPWHSAFRVVNSNEDFDSDSPGRNYPGTSLSVTEALKKSDLIVIGKLAKVDNLIAGSVGEEIMLADVTVVRVFKGKIDEKKQLRVWIDRKYIPDDEASPREGRTFVFFIKSTENADSFPAVGKMLPINEETIKSVTQPSN
jgi:hypothetical protein